MFYIAAYIYVVALIIIDLFRDHTLAGGWKALWIIFLVLVPFLTALVYVIARGRGMAARASIRRGVVPETDEYRPAALPRTRLPRSSAPKRSWMPAQSRRANSTRSRARHSGTSSSAPEPHPPCALPKPHDRDVRRAAPLAGRGSSHVPVVGVEPTRPFGQPILSRSRLPFRHTGLARPH